MHGPFLPLYGSGAIMMLVVSMPFHDSILLTYLAGCIGATVLEYFTGVVMEALFKVRYWDYSKERFNFQGHICLKSTLAWGGLTILMTFVVHQYVEMAVFLIPAQLLSGITFLLTAVIFADFSLSFKAALDLRDVLVKLEDAKIELGHLQMRMDVLIALTTEEWEKKFEEHRDDVLQSMADMMEDVGTLAETMEPGKIRERFREKIGAAQKEARRRRTELMAGMEKQMIKIFQANPTMRSALHEEVLGELRKYVTSKKGAQDDVKKAEAKEN